MIHQFITVGIICYIAGAFTTLLAITFMKGACPDSPKKRQEDWEGLQEYRRVKSENRFGRCRRT